MVSTSWTSTTCSPRKRGDVPSICLPVPAAFPVSALLYLRQRKGRLRAVHCARCAASLPSFQVCPAQEQDLLQGVCPVPFG